MQKSAPVMEKITVELATLDEYLPPDDFTYLNRVNKFEPPLSEGKWRKLFAVLVELRKRTGKNYCVYKTNKHLFDTTNHTAMPV